MVVALMTARATVGIVHGARHRVRPPAVPGRDALGAMDAHVSGRPLRRRIRRRASRRAPGRCGGTRRRPCSGSSEVVDRRGPRCARGARARAAAGCRVRAVGRRRRARRDRAGSRSSCVVVEHRARQLGVVGPRAPVHVVGPDHQPHVVDDADLGVHVDRSAVVVLEVAHEDAVAAGALQRCRVARSARCGPDGPATRPSRSGNRGTTTTTCSSGWARERVGERLRGRARDQKYWSSR